MLATKDSNFFFFFAFFYQESGITPDPFIDTFLHSLDNLELFRTSSFKVNTLKLVRAILIIFYFPWPVIIIWLKS